MEMGENYVSASFSWMSWSSDLVNRTCVSSIFSRIFTDFSAVAIDRLAVQ